MSGFYYALHRHVYVNSQGVQELSSWYKTSSVNQNTHLLLLGQEEEEDMLRTLELSATQEEHRPQSNHHNKEDRWRCLNKG